MAVRQISLPNDLNDRLGKEENASELIQKLLYGYYKYDYGDKRAVNKKVEEIMKRKKFSDEEFSKELKDLGIITNKLERDEKEKDKMEEKKRDKLKEFEEITKNNFKVLYGVELKQIEYEEFKSMWDKGEIESIYDYAELKGYIEKE